MVDLTKGTKDDWGYNPDWNSAQAYVSPETAGAGKTSITKKPTTTTSGGTATIQPTTTQPLASSSGTTGGNVSQINYPSQWQQASDIYSSLGGSGYQMPSMWGQGQDWLSQLWNQQGAPTNTASIWNQMEPTLNRAYKEGLDTLQERWGAGNPGVSMSSGLQRSGADLWSRLLENAGLDMANQQIQANEAATNRMYQLPSQAYNFGAGQAGLQSDAYNRQLAAAGGLSGLGSQYAQLPLSVASSMSGLGQSLTNQQINPWIQMMAGMIGNPYMTNQTYQPSTMTNILGVLGSMPWGDIFSSSNKGFDPVAYASNPNNAPAMNTDWGWGSWR